jgi:hypothetical protein
VNLHTHTGVWGNVTYWNAYVANTQMRGQGTFFDARLNNPKKYPLAVKLGDHNMRNNPDLVSSKLATLQLYQLALPAPRPPAGFWDVNAAKRGAEVFGVKARCSTCHVPPLYTEPGWNVHSPEELGIDDFQANRSPEGKYRTTPLRGLFTRMKGGFYHDGRFADLPAVVEHYDRHFKLSLTADEKRDLIEFLKSL